MLDIGDIWKLADCRLREIVPGESYTMWIANITPLEMDEKRLVLGVPNGFFKEWLVCNFKEVIEGAVEEAAGRKLSVSFEECPPAEVPAVHAAAADVHAGATGGRSSGQVAERSEAKSVEPTLGEGVFGAYSLDRRFTFDSFVVGDSNKFAYAACRSVANFPGESLNPLFIHSSTGLGKTHLLQAIAHEILKSNPKCRILYINSEDMMNEYVESMQKEKCTSFRRKFRNMDVLLIDDIQFIATKQGFQEEIFHTFNSLYNSHKQLVFASDRPPHELEGLQKRLVSRFEWGLTTEINVPDLETRMAIIRKKQENQKYKLENDVVFYIASRLKSSVRRLESAVFKLVSWASLSGCKVDRQAAELLLRDVISEESGSIVTVEGIQKLVAGFYNMKTEDMTSRKRPANIAWPRMIAMFFSRRLTDLSLPVIANKFVRNHATVLHAVSSVESRMKEDEAFRSEIVTLEHKIKNM